MNFTIEIYRVEDAKEFESMMILKSGNVIHEFHFSTQQYADAWFSHLCNLPATIYDEDKFLFRCNSIATTPKEWMKSAINVKFNNEVDGFSLTKDSKCLHFYFQSKEEQDKYMNNTMTFYKKVVV